MLRRNYCTAEMDDQTKELVWTFRVEIKQGEGKTKPCAFKLALRQG